MISEADTSFFEHVEYYKNGWVHLDFIVENSWDYETKWKRKHITIPGNSQISQEYFYVKKVSFATTDNRQTGK